MLWIKLKGGRLAFFVSSALCSDFPPLSNLFFVHLWNSCRTSVALDGGRYP